MHPADVTDLVDEEIVELQRQIDNRHDLAVRDLSRTSDTEVRIRFAAAAHRSETVPMPSGLILPGAGGVAMQPLIKVPILGVRDQADFILRVRCDGWDARPPEIDLLDKSGHELVTWPNDTTGHGIVSGHPDYTRPFFCRPGTREFHSHPVHADDPWDTYREGMPLYGIILGLLGDLTHRWVMRG